MASTNHCDKTSPNNQLTVVSYHNNNENRQNNEYIQNELTKIRYKPTAQA